MVKIEVDGKEIQARDGAMVIEAADDAGVYIPRFCYHKKLSVAANCRMCLVEVDKARKPLPACATPVTDGMKVFTRSRIALMAQKGVMEFLLINHPLDCPICDQGGECELQDVAMGYGGDVSRFSERKRVVAEKYIGPLIATDMTRCIHCTRCVRFGSEIAGIKELGATGRGEHMQIGTYVEATVDSELSGNMIDLCPVGALTSRPFRYTARSWEMQQNRSIAPHDCLGSNINAHVRRGEIMRVVPLDNEQINETWISDRDRFAYEGLYHDDRVGSPMIKDNGGWKTVSWETALNYAVEGLKSVVSQGADKMGFLAAANATLEEHYLFQKLARGLGVSNIDHRLQQRDFADQDCDPMTTSLGQSIENLENIGAALIVGANIRKDQPLLSHRIRKAALNNQARVSFINAVDYEVRFPVAESALVPPSEFVRELAAVAKAVQAQTKMPAMEGLDGLLKGVESNATHQAMAKDLVQNNNATVLLGMQAMQHPEYNKLRMLAFAIAQMSESKLGFLNHSANSVGASAAGVLPHREAGNKSAAKTGLNASTMLESKLDAYVLLNIEPEYDCIDGQKAMQAMSKAGFVISLTPYKTATIEQYADVILPISTYAETAGTFVNAAGTVQSFEGMTSPHMEARPAWKVLRVLGNMCELQGFDYMDIEEVRGDVSKSVGDIRVDNHLTWRCPPDLGAEVKGIQRVVEMPIYNVDSIVRRADALQKTEDASVAAVFMNEQTAQQLAVEEGKNVDVQQGDRSARLKVVIDNRVAQSCVRIATATTKTLPLGGSLDPVTLIKS
ncbi:MAG: NADH-quinone oxidoreductase subunit NuoG [Gammaproteobacteria bacterium]|nr:NADH-quinone oxidoreductase subunit NuoG [Gammaproteobacteria bacterium]